MRPLKQRLEPKSPLLSRRYNGQLYGLWSTRAWQWLDHLRTVEARMLGVGCPNNLFDVLDVAARNQQCSVRIALARMVRTRRRAAAAA